MEKNAQIWRQKAGPIFTAVLIYSIAGILATLVGSLTPTTAMHRIDGGNILFYILGITNLVGLTLFIMALGNFGVILDERDGRSIGNVRTGSILNLIGVVLSLIPFMGWAGGIFNLIGWIMMLVGYMSLKNSPSFPAKARKGASNLFLAMIVSLTGGLIMLIFGWIPIIRVVGGIIAFILYAVAFLLMLCGWLHIKNADPDVL